MTRIEALTELAAKVEAGMFRPTFAGPEHTAFPGMEGGNSLIRHHIRYAYHGSLDAAKALHEALLPGWWYKVMNGCGPAFAQVGMPGIEVISGTHDTNPARAWLLAIIRALIAQERSQALQDLADADRDLI